jgi:hypothetical protein
MRKARTLTRCLDFARNERNVAPRMQADLEKLIESGKLSSRQA